jgi:hypothetical protein
MDLNLGPIDLSLPLGRPPPQFSLILLCVSQHRKLNDITRIAQYLNNGSHEQNIRPNPGQAELFEAVFL